MKGKSLLAIAFGIGRLPKKLASELQAEGVVISDDGIPMSRHFVDYCSPRKRSTSHPCGRAGAFWSRRWIPRSSLPYFESGFRR